MSISSLMSSLNSAKTTNRLTGMFSGLDTDSLVTALVSGKQAKIDQKYQSVTLSEWKRDAYTDFNNKLRVFREEFGSALGSTSLMSKSGIFDYTVENQTNSSALSVTASANAKAGTYKVSVRQLATAASMNGAKVSSSSSGISSNDIEKTAIGKLTGLANGAFQGAEDGSISFNINGKDFSFKATDTLKTVMDTVNKSGAGVKMSYSQITDSFAIQSLKTGSLSETGELLAEPVKPDSFWMTAPNADDFTDDASYQAELKMYSDAYAVYSEQVLKPYQDELAAYNEQQATLKLNEGKSISFEDTDGFLAHLGMTSVTAGQDAVVSVNGGENRVYAENSFTLDGITFNVSETTAAGETANFTVARNLQSSVDKIKKFVEDFNTLMSDLNTAYTQKKNYDYVPLTATQKEQLSDSEIELWDGKAKEGLMKGDNNLSVLINKLRSAFSSSLGGEGLLSSIGISQSKYAAGESFKLEIDEEKLKKALSDDPDKVYNMFSAIDSDVPSNTGLMDRLNTAMDSFISNTRSINIQNLNNSIYNTGKEITDLENSLALASEKYYVQYAKLETSLAQMQAQSDQVSNMFGSN